MTTITKSLSVDFGGSWNQSQLHNEIASDISITKTINAINLKGDSIDIIFSEELSAPELLSLDGIIAGHSPDENFGVILPFEVSVDPRKNRFNGRNYTRVIRTEFPGSTNAKLFITGYKQSNVTSYNIKVIDLTNNNVLLEGQCDNDKEQACDMGYLQSLSTSNCSIEVQVKKNGGSGRVYVENVTILYA